MVATYPRAWLNVNGIMIPCISASVSRKSKRASDEFSAEISISRAATLGMDITQWADWQPTDVTLTMASAVDGSDQRDMATGKVDRPEIDWLEMKVHVKGRDKSASLTETKRNQTFKNQKSSDICSTIASDNGLGVAAQDTSDYAGQIYDQDTIYLAQDRSDWEVMDDLADREGYRWYVDGTTLYFEPDDQSNGNFQVFYTPPSPGEMALGNVIKLTTGRNMTAARPHTSRVKSFHSKDKKVYKSEQTADGVGDPVTYEHHHNGRNQSQIDKLAKSRLKNAKRHDMDVSIEMPGDLTCDVRQTLTLSGTGTIYDQDYDIDSVHFEIEWGKGFEMTIEAKAAKQGTVQ